MYMHVNCTFLIHGYIYSFAECQCSAGYHSAECCYTLFGFKTKMFTNSSS